MRINANIPLNIQAPQSKPSPEDARLKKACKDFEAVMVNQMLSKMRDTVPKADLFGSGEKEAMFQGMLDSELAQRISDTGSMQLADIMYKQLSSEAKKG